MKKNKYQIYCIIVTFWDGEVTLLWVFSLVGCSEHKYTRNIQLLQIAHQIL